MLFDIRTIVGALLGLYGIILTVTGLVHETAADHDRTGGWNVNLWTGIGLIVVAIVFLAWARLRPVRTRKPGTGTDETPAGPADSGD
jgi:drug/metabolite transporter (DMT)-like permease